MRIGRLTTTVMLAATAAITAGCSASTSAQTQATVTPTVTPVPTRTIVKNSRVVHAGRTVRFVAQQGVSLRLRASAPGVSRTSLSPNYGYPPSHGYYVTFQLTITNTGRKSVEIGPADFVLTLRGQGRVTSYDGNGPYSGAHAQLDTTELAPGDVVRAPLSFDVRTTHGQLLFVPDRSAAIVWRF